MATGDGYLIITGPAGVIEADTVQCGHCQKHYTVKPGSGKRRGFCTLCSRATCGAAACLPCKPWEKRLEEFERRERLMAALQL